jgi:hypothetical protein
MVNSLSKAQPVVASLVIVASILMLPLQPLEALHWLSTKAVVGSDVGLQPNSKALPLGTFNVKVEAFISTQV